MRTKAEIAAEDYLGSVNCAQAVLAVFAEDYDLDQESALRIGAGLGGGCHSGEICGAISAGSAVVGLKCGNTKRDPAGYANCQLKTREFITDFREKYGAVTCRDLLGVDVSLPGGRERALELNLFKTRCKDIVRTAVDILEKLGY